MLLAGRKSGESSGAGRITSGALFTGIAMIALMAGIACVVAAFWIFLIPRIGDAGAALASGGLLLGASGVLMLVARSIFDGDDDDGEEAAPLLGEDLLENLREGFDQHKGIALIAALVAGLLAGNARKN